MNSWLQALKLFNQGKPKYTVPKKGSAEYKKVKDIQKKIDKQKGGASISQTRNMRGTVVDYTPAPTTGSKIVQGMQEVMQNPVYQAFTSVGMPSTSGATTLGSTLTNATLDALGRVVQTVSNRRRRR